MNNKYIAPQVIRLDDSDLAHGDCTPTGSTPGLSGACAPSGVSGYDVGYRVNGFEGICVTGKSAGGGCHAGKG